MYITPILFTPATCQVLTRAMWRIARVSSGDMPLSCPPGLPCSYNRPSTNLPAHAHTPGHKA